MDQSLYPIIEAGPKNGKVKQVLSLLNNAKPNPNQLMVLEGIWAIEKAIQKAAQLDSFFFCPELATSLEAQTLIRLLQQRVPSFRVSQKTFLSMTDRGKPDGMLVIVRWRHSTFEHLVPSSESQLIVLDGVEIPGNIGTIVRTADGCSALGVLISNRRARITHPKMVKGSQGSLFSVPIIESDVRSIYTWCKTQGFQLLLTDSRSSNAFDHFPYESKVAVIFGSERYGISKEWYDCVSQSISIPMKGMCDSLNVAVASGIVMYHISRYHETNRSKP